MASGRFICSRCLHRLHYTKNTTGWPRSQSALPWPPSLTSTYTHLGCAIDSRLIDSGGGTAWTQLLLAGNSLSRISSAIDATSSVPATRLGISLSPAATPAFTRGTSTSSGTTGTYGAAADEVHRRERLCGTSRIASCQGFD